MQRPAGLFLGEGADRLTRPRPKPSLRPSARVWPSGVRARPRPERCARRRGRDGPPAHAPAGRLRRGSRSVPVRRRNSSGCAPQPRIARRLARGGSPDQSICNSRLHTEKRFGSKLTDLSSIYGETHLTRGRKMFQIYADAMMVATRMDASKAEKSGSGKTERTGRLDAACRRRLGRPRACQRPVLSGSSLTVLLRRPGSAARRPQSGRRSRRTSC